MGNGNVGKVVLIAEDEPALRAALAEEFAMAGYTVREAADGVEGVKLARETTPNLILLDLLMPRKSGVEMMRELEDEEWARDVPVIILTNVGLGEKQVKDVVRENPAWYLMKANHSLEEVKEKAEAMMGLAEASLQNKK